MTMLLEIGRVAWIGSILALAIFVPVVVVRRRHASVADLVAQLATTSLAAIVIITALSRLTLLNPVTLAAAFCCWPIAKWVTRHRRSIGRDGRAAAWSMMLAAVRWWESGDRRAAAIRYGHAAAAEFALAWHNCIRSAHLTAFLAVAAVILVAPRMVPALLNTRLGGTAAYGELIVAQQMVTGETASLMPQPFAAMSAALSMASSIGVVHVLRWLPPIMSFLTILVLIVLVSRSSGSIGAAVIAAATMTWLSAPMHEPSTTLANLFLVLALFAWRERLAGGAIGAPAAIAATVVAALAAPYAALFICVAVGCLLVTQQGLALAVTGVAWLLLSWLQGADGPGAVAVPLAISLMVGGIVQKLAAGFPCDTRPRRLAAGLATAVCVFAAGVPRSSGIQYVEYDAAARKSLDIATTFPRYRFMVVGPVEQWALTYGRGWHMNLYEFVERVGAALERPVYQLPFNVDDVFVFVETQPFATFAREPRHVPFAVLNDPVFRHYRSLPGRSSLQFAALDVCERLRQIAPAEIYYQDDQLRIYRFMRAADGD